MCPASSARSHAGPAAIGRYEVHEEIGRGSSGVVYLARDPLIGRWVAVKPLSEDYAPDPDRVAALRRRLLNEAQSAGGLSHPGIVAVYDVIEHDGGRLSITCEHVDGTDLRRRLGEPEPLPLEFAARVVTEVGAALDYAHEAGVIHRDLKPANILLGADGAIKVTDFGIAGLRDRQLADELKRLGSPNYLAPERILGGEAEARSDVYSLGVVLYEMLTRNLPFSGDTVAELARNIVERQPAPVEHYRRGVYPEILRVLDRALAKEPVERYDKAGEMAGELRRALAEHAERNDTVPTPVIEELALAEENGETPVPQAADDSSSARPPARGRRPWLLLLPAFLGLMLAGAAFVGGRLSSVPPAQPAAAALDAAADQRLEYLRLLAESRRLFAAGEHAIAQRLLDRAEEISPAGARIRRLREEARRQALAERRALAEAEAMDLLDRARADLEAGRLSSAATRVERALALTPESTEAQELRRRLERLQAQRLARERSREDASAPPPAKPAREEPFKPFTPPVAAIKVAGAEVGTGDLRVDFYSERPRGVLTVYADANQVLNRPFRFFEKRKLGRRGIPGGFDARAQLPAGEIELRIYLTLPDEETQLETVVGGLPAGSLRTLRVRVGADGRLATELH